MKESRLKTLLRNDLSKDGWYARKMNPHGNAGFPDLLAVKDMFLGIELKQASSFKSLLNPKKFTPIQDHNRKQILEAGGAFLLLGSNTKSKMFGIFWKEPTINPLYIETESYKAFYQAFFNVSIYGAREIIGSKLMKGGIKL